MITSAANEKIKAIVKLRQHKERQKSGLFYIEGIRIVVEAVQQAADIEMLVTAPGLLTSPVAQPVVEQQRARGVTVLETSNEVFERLALKENPQGLAAVVRQRWTQLEEISPQPGADWVALDAVQDPGNLGTILRTSDAVGAAGVILLDQSTDPYDPTALRASMGAIFTQRIVKTSLAAFAAWKKASGLPLIGTSGASQQDYHQSRYPNPMVLLMGSERQGLLPPHLQLCDQVVRIPMQGRSDSLNLAVATAVMLYEIYNQRRDRPVGG